MQEDLCKGSRSERLLSYNEWRGEKEHRDVKNTLLRISFLQARGSMGRLALQTGLKGCKEKKERVRNCLTETILVLLCTTRNGNNPYSVLNVLKME